MAQVRWSLTAGTDLQEIEDFIARDSLLHAITFVDYIVESAETFLKTPLIGRVVPEFNHQDLREVILGDTGSCTSCRATRSLFFALCTVNEIYSD